jgi:hypothetical protein
MAKIAAFPHRAIPHTTPAIEEAIAAKEDLRGAKQAKRAHAAAPVPMKGIGPEVETISSLDLRVRIRNMLGRSFEPHEIEWLKRWYPQGAPEDQVYEIFKRLAAQLQPSSEIDPAAAGAGEE